MNINKNKTTKEIQTEFKVEFPKLDIKFYTKKHDEFHGSQIVDEVTTNELLGKLNPNNKDGQIDISPYVTVLELETAFEEAFGLHVQIFRKSGNIWLQTTNTDHWTLKEQQQNAENMEKYENDRKVV